MLLHKTVGHVMWNLRWTACYTYEYTHVHELYICVTGWRRERKGSYGGWVEVGWIWGVQSYYKITAFICGLKRYWVWVSHHNPVLTLSSPPLPSPYIINIWHSTTCMSRLMWCDVMIETSHVFVFCKLYRYLTANPQSQINKYRIILCMEMTVYLNHNIMVVQCSYIHIYVCKYTCIITS